MRAFWSGEFWAALGDKDINLLNRGNARINYTGNFDWVRNMYGRDGRGQDLICRKKGKKD